MDRMEAMSILLRAVDAGSLSKASRELGLPLATVSRKVSELEKHLGASLLVRSARGLAPTPAGQSFIEAARSILEQLADAERLAAGEYTAPRGSLVITAPVMFGRLYVLPVVTAFLRAFPQVNVKLVLTDRLAHLVDDQIDVAVRIGELPDSSLRAGRIGTVRRVVCASPAYLAEYGMPGRPEDLPHHAAILADGLSSADAWLFGPGAAYAGPQSRFSVNSVEAAIDAATAGLGLVRVLSYQVAGHVRQGELAVILAAFEPAPPPVHLIYAGQARMPVKLRAFMDFATPRLRERLARAGLD